jgi:transposase
VSKSRLVITAVVVEARSQGEAARAYGVSQGWVSRLVARYRDEGEAAFEPRSRRPRSSPTATSAQTVQRIVELRKELIDAGLDAALVGACTQARIQPQAGPTDPRRPRRPPVPGPRSGWSRRP